MNDSFAILMESGTILQHCCGICRLSASLKYSHNVITPDGQILPWMSEPVICNLFMSMYVFIVQYTGLYSLRFNNANLMLLKWSATLICSL